MLLFDGKKQKTRKVCTKHLFIGNSNSKRVRKFFNVDGVLLFHCEPEKKKQEKSKT